MRAVNTLWTVAGLLLASGPATGPCGAIQHDGKDILEPRSSMESAPGEFREGRYTDEHGTLRYRLYLPNAGAGTARPLVVMLHGCTQDPVDFAVGTRANEHAEAAGAIVLYPEQPQSAHPQKCWSWFDPAHQARGAGEPALLAGTTRAVIEETGADPERIFTAGISAGGSMAQILTAAYPELYRALAVHSAPAYRSAGDVATALSILRQGVTDAASLPGRVLAAMGDRARPVPTLVVHGSVDPVVRVVNGEQVLRQWAEVARRSGTATPQKAGAPIPTGCPDVPGLSVETSTIEARKPALRCVYSGAAVALEYWAVEGMGHAWSGGSEAGTYTDPAGPDATERVFRFLLGQEPPTP